MYSLNGCQTIKKFLVLGLFLILFTSLSFAATTYWKNATATGENHNEWATPTNAFLDDGNDATETGKNEQQDYYNYQFTEIAGALSIDSVEIQLEDFSAGDTDDTIGIYVSCNAAGGWSLENLATAPGTGGAADYIWNITNLGADIDASGCSEPITIAQLGDLNFRVRIEAEETAKGAGYWDVDWVPVRVFYTPPALPATTYSAYVSVYNANGTVAVTDDYFVGNGSGNIETGYALNTQQEYNSGNSIATLNITPDTDYRIIVQIKPEDNNGLDWDGDATGETFITVLGTNKYVYYLGESSATDKELVISVTEIDNLGGKDDDIWIANNTALWEPNSSLRNTLPAQCEYGNTSVTNDPDGEYHVDFYEGAGEDLESCLGGALYTGYWGIFEFVFSPDDEWNENGENVTFNFTVATDAGDSLVGLNFTVFVTARNTSLYTWDIEDDAENMPPPPTGWSEDTTVTIGENTWFWANYTLNDTGSEISDSVGNCTLWLNHTPTYMYNMTWNATAELWYFNTSFSSQANYTWNVTCNGSAYGYKYVNSSSVVEVLGATTYKAYVVIYDSRETTVVTDDWLVGAGSNETAISLGSEYGYNSGSSVADVRGNSSTVYRVLVQIMPEDGNWDIDGDAAGDVFIHINESNQNFSDSDSGVDKELIRTTTIGDVAPEGANQDDIIVAEYTLQWKGNTSRPGGECEYGDLSSTNDPYSESHVDYCDGANCVETCVGATVSQDSWLLLEFYFQTDENWATNDVIEFEVVAGSDSGNALVGFHFNVTVTPVVNLGFSLAYPSTGCSDGKGCTGGVCPACEYCYFETTDLQGPADETNVSCNGQNSTTFGDDPNDIPFFNLTNNGNVDFNWTIELNESLPLGLWGKLSLGKAGWEATCSAGNGPAAATTCITFNTTEKTVNISIAPSSSQPAWVWADFVAYEPWTYGNETDRNATSYSYETP